MSVRCPYGVYTTSVRCPYDVPSYVRGMSVTVCPVRCPYDVRTMSVPYPAIYYTSRALSRFFFFSAVLSSPDFKFLNSKKPNVRCPYDVRAYVRGMSVVCPWYVRAMSVRCPYDVRTMSVRCPYDVYTTSVRCPVVCPRYVRGMSRTMSVRCPYDVRAISCDIYTSRALSRVFFLVPC